MWRAVAAGLALAAAAPTAAARHAAPDHACTYASRTAGEITHFEKCARLVPGGRPIVTRQHLRDVDYDRFGLSTLFIDQWYVVRRDGAIAPVLAMDNWAEDFSDGRARSPVGGKVGFIDRRLKLVIPARYDGALPFHDGMALVCIGCSSKSDGEHSYYTGGRAFCVDRYGAARPALGKNAPSDCPRARPARARRNG